MRSTRNIQSKMYQTIPANQIKSGDLVYTSGNVYSVKLVCYGSRVSIATRSFNSQPSRLFWFDADQPVMAKDGAKFNSLF